MASEVRRSNREAERGSAPASDDNPPLITGRYLFLRRSFGELSDFALACGYAASVWTPSVLRPWPARCPLRRKLGFLFRAALSIAGLECGAICIYWERRIIHYSAFSSRYWRFPFMSGEDLQIGGTWTDPEHRGKGLAQFAIRQILKLKRKPGRNFWYCVEEHNSPSVQVARRTGFEIVAQGVWRKPLGLKLFGSYVPDISATPPDHEPAATPAHPN